MKSIKSDGRVEGWQDKMKTNKFDLAVRMAKHLLTLPPGSWPETEQAEGQLDDALPRGVTYDQIIAIARRQQAYIHPDRRAAFAEQDRRDYAAERAKLPAHCQR